MALTAPPKPKPPADLGTASRLRAATAMVTAGTPVEVLLLDGTATPVRLRLVGHAVDREPGKVPVLRLYAAPETPAPAAG